jgi:4-hydroxy-3-polyprenylbenzoate decarboxylase
MYRIQLGGNRYAPDREVGLHYQIHRGIGVHHSAAAERGEPLRVSVFVGGPPAHAFAAVMPLPEGLSELTFAGMLAGRRFRWARVGEHVVSADADFAIVGRVDPKRTLPEGPFGDHLGYYSLARVHALHAVDSAGVHPLMLAIGSERYVPWQPRAPREVLTQACAILGFGQASLAKWLFMAAREDAPALEIHDVAGFLQHVLARVDLERDLHFHTRTTIDTLDYSGTALNEGSKLVVAGVGAPRRELGRELPRDLSVPAGWGPVASILPGVIAIGGPPHDGAPLRALLEHLAAREELAGPRTPWPLLVVVDDVGFVAESLRNFLWVTFTRTNPSHDVDGIGAGVEHKHWGCKGALVVDARSKAHHAPPLVEDPAVERRVDRLFVRGGPLHGVG